MLQYNEFINEALIKMKHYSEADIIEHSKKFLKKEIDYIPTRMINFYNASIYQLRKKFAGYDPDKVDQEGEADEFYIKILNKVYINSTR